MYSQNDLLSPLRASSGESTGVPFALRRRSPKVYTYSLSNPQSSVSRRRVDGYSSRLSRPKPRVEGKIERDLKLREEDALRRKIEDDEALQRMRIREDERKASIIKRDEALKLDRLRSEQTFSSSRLGQARARNFGLRSEEAQLEEAMRLSLQESENFVPQTDSLLTTVAKVVSLSPLTKNK